MASGLVSRAERLRPSVADRERVADVLRRACEHERLSIDTFALRLDMLYAARTRAELDELLRDLPEPNRVRRAVLLLVGWSSRWTHDVASAWRTPRRPRLVLPLQDVVTIGRTAVADFVVADQTVSARHAVLTHADGAWSVRDAGSRNGTFLNGFRVRSETEVRAGDELTVGSTRFVLVSPRPR